MTKDYLSGGIELTDYISYTSFFKARKIIKDQKKVGLYGVWKQIKKKTANSNIHILSKEEIRRFFRISKDGVHPYLK
ncbi:hypothetical protein HGA88_05935 [Candidatus Roizmanbacteria bacterium]|nr:hypothetical protein [Candidatus Roizmanbacteria bacterium]